MSLDKIFNVAGAIVVLAGITVAVTNTETARIIGALGDAFTGSIRAASGK